MPRIRKKTSKRGTSHQRGKIRQKVAETRKKRKKEAKKNPQWKSKHHKDPGIPNNFPYKDQLLAEAAEERRQQIEQKTLRKAGKLAAGKDNVGDENMSNYPTLIQASGSSRTAPQPTDETQGNVCADLSHFQAVLDVADVVVEVLDARDPRSYRSSFVERTVKEKGKSLILLLNKIDLCPREAVQAWLNELEPEALTFPFHAASAFTVASLPTAETSLTDAVGARELLAALQSIANSKAVQNTLTVVVVGLTNVGKSSVLNSLIHKSALPVYKISSTAHDSPSTTVSATEVSMDVNEHVLRFIDTPGLIYETSTEGNSATPRRTRDIILRNKGRIDKLKDPAPVVADIISRMTREDLMLHYNIPAFISGDVNAFLTAIARKHGLLNKDGSSDIAAACRVVLKDWNTSKLPYYTSPMSMERAAPTAAHEQILSALRSRKDWRKSPGLLKMSPGAVDTRTIDLSTPWLNTYSLDNSAEDANEDAQGGNGGHKDAEDEDEGLDELQSDDEPVSVVAKRKRSPATTSQPATKRVAFVTPPKTSIRNSSATGSRKRVKR